MVEKVTLSQQILQATAPIKCRKRRSWFSQNRFYGEPNVGDVGVDHTKFERADGVSVASVHIQHIGSRNHWL
ncbi:hypothetical protein AWB74_08701 [Caballeronia arvi]|uniref:Uncharacterized protein n=1 Tax=Caballeronia arvi TaxID=1777135 RepID=A0A158L5L9_9BURK|nr:hypothetical protein [Caballeronia arvi]SAL88724.1 hypothetical protein AWB74_08701 [Caballeronia arvi]